MHKPDPTEQTQKLAELIKDVKFAMLTTTDSEGNLHSTPMTTQEFKEGQAFDGTLWFFVSASGGKAKEIQAQPLINLSYAEPKSNHYVSVSGRAQVLRDPAKAKDLWNPFVKAWFPKGPEDPDLALLKVEVTKAEYWDLTSSKAIQIYGLAKALLTGRSYGEDGEDRGQHQKVNLA